MSIDKEILTAFENFDMSLIKKAGPIFDGFCVSTYLHLFYYLGPASISTTKFENYYMKILNGTSFFLKNISFFLISVGSKTSRALPINKNIKRVCKSFYHLISEIVSGL